MLTCELKSLKIIDHETFQHYFNAISSSQAQAALVMSNCFESRQNMMDRMLKEVEVQRVLRDCGIESTILAMMLCPSSGQEAEHTKRLLLTFAVTAQSLLENSDEYKQHLSFIHEVVQCWLSKPNEMQQTLSNIYKTSLQNGSHLLERARYYVPDEPTMWLAVHDEKERCAQTFCHLINIAELIHLLPNSSDNQAVELSQQTLNARLKLFDHFHRALTLMVEQNVFKTLYRAMPKEDRLIQRRDFNLDHNVKTQTAVNYLNPKSQGFTLKNRRKAIEAFAERFDKAQQNVYDIFKRNLLS